MKIHFVFSRLKLARLHTKFVCDVQYFNIRSLEISRMSIFMLGSKMCKVTWFCICVLFSTRITQAINELTKLLLFYVCDFHRNHFIPFKADIWIDFANTHLEISFITLTRNIVYKKEQYGFDFISDCIYSTIYVRNLPNKRTFELIYFRYNGKRLIFLY